MEVGWDVSQREENNEGNNVVSVVKSSKRNQLGWSRNHGNVLWHDERAVDMVLSEEKWK